MEAAKEEKDEKLDEVEIDPVSDTEEQDTVINDESVVVQRKIDCSYFRGIERGYIYNEKIKLIYNQLGSSYRHLGNYFR
jgi:hypothetical protein